MIPLALIGLGKIARWQHVPVLAASGDFRLAATVDPAGGDFPSLEAMLAARRDVRAVMLCTPPQVRFAVARQALLAGLDVALEKPPGTSVSEVETLARIARAEGRVLFATWHSQFAPGIAVARDWLAARRITGLRVVWREDVRKTHPGQDWIFAPGGTGVFDPGINAFSVLTAILPVALHVTQADLDFPEGRDTPIAARFRMETEEGAPCDFDFDFREDGEPVWDMDIDTDAGTLRLSRGGALIEAGGQVLSDAPPLEGEYAAIYARFAALIAARDSDVDLAPFRHVADAMMLGRRRVVAPFSW